jgi:iron complex outermembrane receptor protein
MTAGNAALSFSFGALLAISSVALADAPSVDTAAAATKAESSASESEDRLEEIVVTAQKRSENLEEVPVAVSAFTSKQRDLIGIQTVQDLTDFTPGLGYSNALDRAFIRGVGRDTNNLATQPGVATYNDGVYNSSVFAAAGDPLFVDRVEVLRGPQGTLYGRNSIGGTINAISRRPTSDWYAEVRANIANYGTYNFEAAVSGPINDALRFRLAAYRNTQQDGYFNNLAIPGNSAGGKGDSFYWEAQLEWDITSNVQFWLKASQVGYENGYRTFNTIGSYSYVALPPGTLSPGAAFGFLQPTYTALNAAQCNNNPGSIDVRSYCNNTPDNAKLQRDYQVTPQLTWKTPYGFDIKYIGAYTTYYYELHTDFDNTSMQSYVYPRTNITMYSGAVVTRYIENKKYWSNELNFTSDNNSSFQWIAGLYQYAEHVDQPVDFPVPGQDQLQKPLLLSPFGPAVPNVRGDNIYYSDLNVKAHSYAVFAQTDWKFVPKWTLTTGIRYTHDETSGPEATRQLFFNPPQTGNLAFDITRTLISTAPAPGVEGPPTLDPTTGDWVRQLKASWNGVTGTAGLTWQPSDSLLSYFKYSRGYKAGGLNAGTIVALPETQSEYLNAYELGIKYSVNKFQINQAFFWYDYQGLQIPLTVQPTQGPAITETFNIPRSISFGSESEIIFVPIADWQFLLDYSYLEAYVDSSFRATNNTATFTQPGYATSPPGAPLSGGSTNVDGATLPISPRHKVAFNSNYTWRFAPGFLNFSASYVYKAPTYSSIFNEPYTLAPGYSTLDFRTTWTDVHDRYTVYVYCHNCTNKIGYDSLASGAAVQSTTNASLNSTTQTPGIIPPRQYGIEIQWRPKFK